MDILTVYERNDGLKPDWKEKFGNVALGALRIAFGKFVTVSYRGKLDEWTAPATDKAIAIAALILFSPICIVAIPLGILATRLSETYGKKLPFKPNVPSHQETKSSPKDQETKSSPKEEPLKNRDPAPVPPHSPEPVKERPKFNLTDEQINLINKGENQPLNARFATLEEIRDYINAYKDKMNVLWVEGIDFTKEEELFKNHIFNRVHLNNCKIAGQQVAQLSGIQSSGHAALNEIKFTNGTLDKENAKHLCLEWADKCDLSNNNLTTNDLSIYVFRQHHFRELILSGNQFAENIFKLAYSSSYLKILDLSNNQINDAGLIHAKELFKNLNLTIDLSNNQITALAFEDFIKTVDFESITQLKVTSSILDEKTHKALLAAAAKDYKQKGLLLQNGFTPQEIGITKASDLSYALNFCHDIQTLDASGIDLSRPEYVNTIINNRSVFNLKHFKLVGCNLTERGLLEIKRLEKLEILDLDQNPAIDETVVKECYDGEIPPFIKNISPIKRSPTALEVELLTLKKRDLEENVLGTQARIFEIRQNLFNYYVNKIESLKETETKYNIRFNISKRFGFEFTPDQVIEIDNCLDDKPFNKDKLVQLILSFAKCATLQEIIQIKIAQSNDKAEPEKYIIENENLFALKGLTIDEELKAKVNDTAKLSARLKVLCELLAISENEMITTIVNTEKKLGQNSTMTHEQLIDEILNVLTYTDLDKATLKNDLMKQAQLDLEAIKIAICKAANIKSIMNAHSRERYLPIVIKL